MIKNGEKIQVSLFDNPPGVDAHEGTVTLVHPDGETVSALVDGRVVGVVFAEEGQPRQTFVRRGIRHFTYRRLSWTSRAAATIRRLYGDVVHVLGR